MRTRTFLLLIFGPAKSASYASVPAWATRLGMYDPALRPEVELYPIVAMAVDMLKYQGTTKVLLVVANLEDQIHIHGIHFSQSESVVRKDPRASFAPFERKVDYCPLGQSGKSSHPRVPRVFANKWTLIGLAPFLLQRGLTVSDSQNEKRYPMLLLAQHD